jgi:hypothetical protein
VSSLQAPVLPAADELDPATEIRRGTMRLLASLDLMPLAEVTLDNGRRADLLAVGPDGRIVLVEIKSCARDFLSDAKWRDYLPWADGFYFAVAPGFPLDLLPEDEGLIIADRYAGEVLRPARQRPVPAARRRALLLRFGRLAAARVQALTDPASRL